MVQVFMIDHDGDDDDLIAKQGKTRCIHLQLYKKVRNK